MRKVKVNAPATVANLVCGFDILGMALNDPQDEMTLSLSDEPGIRIRHTDEYNLSESPYQNVAGVALLALMEECEEQAGFDLIIHKQIKPGSGLGSSAASSAGAVVAANLFIRQYIFKGRPCTLCYEWRKACQRSKACR